MDSLPEHRKWDHVIELVSDLKSPHQKLYLLSPVEQAELDKFFRSDPSIQVPACCTLLLHQKLKKDGSLQVRPVQDYWYLNSIRVKNKYLLLLVDNLVQRLKGAQYFTKLDVRWGYNNVRIREGDK